MCSHGQARFGCGKTSRVTGLDFWAGCYPARYPEPYLEPSLVSFFAAQALNFIGLLSGGRTRIRTLDPLIKSMKLLVLRCIPVLPTASQYLVKPAHFVPGVASSYLAFSFRCVYSASTADQWTHTMKEQLSKRTIDTLKDQAVAAGKTMYCYDTVVAGFGAYATGRGLAPISCSIG